MSRNGIRTSSGVHLSPPIVGAVDTSQHRPFVNITPAERWGRIVLGPTAMLVGSLLIFGTAGVLGIILEGLLIVAGLDLVVTGLVGHCPLYARLNYVPTSLKGPR